MRAASSRLLAIGDMMPYPQGFGNESGPPPLASPIMGRALSAGVGHDGGDGGVGAIAGGRRASAARPGRGRSSGRRRAAGLGASAALLATVSLAPAAGALSPAGAAPAGGLPARPFPGRVQAQAPAANVGVSIQDANGNNQPGPGRVNIGTAPVGDANYTWVTLTNHPGAPLSIASTPPWAGLPANDLPPASFSTPGQWYANITNCVGSLAPAASCNVWVVYEATGYDQGDATFEINTSAGQVGFTLQAQADQGYDIVTTNNEIATCGDIDTNLASATPMTLAQPVVGASASPYGTGLLSAASDGGVFAFGDAPFLGSMGGRHLDKPIDGMAAHEVASSATNASGIDGYWLVAADGGIFAFGNAPFYGSMGGKHLDQPIVGMASTPDGKGYWLVASDGGIFAYGDANFFGSMGGRHLDSPIVGMATTPDGKGYWLVASDGGIFAYGDASFQGSKGGQPLNAPIVGMAAVPAGQGYELLGSDGGVYPFGDAANDGGSEGLSTAAAISEDGVPSARITLVDWPPGI
jgi:hypothetical protein